MLGPGSDCVEACFVPASLNPGPLWGHLIYVPCENKTGGRGTTCHPSSCPLTALQSWIFPGGGGTAAAKRLVHAVMVRKQMNFLNNKTVSFVSA